MTSDQEQLRDDMMAARTEVSELAEKLASDGLHPIMVIEGAMIAILELNQKQLGNGALIDWLRDAADHIEAFALPSTTGRND